MRIIPFNDDWRMTVDPGRSAYYKKNLDWTPVTLPHDATIHEHRSPDAPSATHKGYFPNGDYLYEKTFPVPAAYAGQRLALEFEGVYANARVFLNDNYIGGCPNGYAGFILPLNDLVRIGEVNKVTVQLHSDLDSRWYAGAGIYRDVHLLVADPLHIPPNGVRLTTCSADPMVAAVEAEVTVVNESVDRREPLVTITVTDGDGRTVCRDRRLLTVAGGDTDHLHARLYIRNPALWSPETPHCYRVHVTLTEGERITDEAVVETFGIRTLTLDNVRGLAVNGQPVKLYGCCIHHDNGILGAATFACAEERRVALLRGAGYNAIRMAHHPMSKALLAACDRAGMLVMDELTDMWNESKSRRDYGQYIDARWETDVRAMVEKDYNHPSVVLYSLGNEIPEFGTAAGARRYRKLADLLRTIDRTRYLTAGMSIRGACVRLEKEIRQKDPEGLARIENDPSVTFDGVTPLYSLYPDVVDATREIYDAMDVAGYNYSFDREKLDHTAWDNWASVASETYPKDIARSWPEILSHPAMLGDFTWTGFDYLGEAGIGRDFSANDPARSFDNPYPWLISYCSDFDITGQQTPQGAWREIVVDHRDTPYIAIQDPANYDIRPIVRKWSWPGTVASWTWPGREGQPVRVEVYGKAEEAELLLDGVSLGRLPIPQETDGGNVACRAVFETVYRPGTLSCVLYRKGEACGRCALETAGPVTTLRAAAERDGIRADGTEVAYIDLSLLDAAGQLNTGADRAVTLRVEGPAVLQGLGSANPCPTGDYFSDTTTTWFGRALAAIRPTGAGTITVTAEAEGCPLATCRITAQN